MCTEQPFIPLGAGVTCYFLVSGLRGKRGGEERRPTDREKEREREREREEEEEEEEEEEGA
jgi:hypothetical protein